MRTSAREAESPATQLETERVEACPICGCTAAEAWRVDARDWQQPEAADRFEYERCSACGAYFLGTRPRESELGKVYFTGYGPYQAAPEAASEPAHASLAARAAALPLHAAGAAIGFLGRRRLPRRLERFYTPERPGEVLLDYGCGTPAFLDEARRRGFDTIGADFTGGVVEAVRASGHRAFLVGDELEEAGPDGSVDRVRMNHVIEHLYRPREALSVIASKLRPGGRIHVSTPNPRGLGSRLFGRRWHALDAPRHVVLYRPTLLRRVLEESGFRDLSVVNEVGPKDLTRSWGIVLYERGRIPHEEIAAMAADRTRFGLFLPVASLGALVAAADRYHVFARRG
jgi:SAM-dependent methyltransferase